MELDYRSFAFPGRERTQKVATKKRQGREDFPALSIFRDQNLKLKPALTICPWVAQV